MKINRLNEYKRLLMDKRYIEAYKHIPPELIKTTTLLGNYFSDSYNGRKSLIFKFIFGSLDMERAFKGIDVSLFGPGYSKKDVASDKGKIKVWRCQNRSTISFCGSGFQVVYKRTNTTDGDH